MDYPLWHSLTPMNALMQGLQADRFVVAGDGIRVQESSGRWLIDARSGCWNLGLGYGADEVKAAIRDQLASLPNASILSYDRPAEVTVRYARALRDAVGATSLRRVRLGNTGSQMTETAVMLSRLVRACNAEPERMTVVSFAASFHGLGLGANAFSGSVADMDSYGPLLPDVHLVDPGGPWAEQVRRALDELGPERVTAVIIEPQMGTLGLVPDPHDLRALHRLCRDTGVHLIADEVTTGFGRVGAMSRCLDLGFEPDILVLAKNLTAGYVPAGALLASEDIYQAVQRAEPPRALPAGSATDGHPIACAAGLAVLRIYQREDILRNVRTVGEHLRQRLQKVHDTHLPPTDVVGSGLMLHLPLETEPGQTWPLERIYRFMTACDEQGLLLSMNMRGAWLAPPLVSTEDDCEEIADAVDRALATCLEEQSER